MKCSSLTPTGSEFSISPAAPAIVSAVAANCSSGFDFDELVITLAAPLASNNYQLIINNGSDINTIRDFCDRDIPPGEQVPFSYFIPQPIFADSIGRVGCAPTELKIYFPKKIKCNTIATDGSDFFVTGPTPVNVQAAGALCTNGQSDVITVTLTAPIYTKGNYQLHLKAGVDGTTVIDECGIELPLQQLPFTTADTVSAVYDLVTTLGCRTDVLQFSHDGAHDVNSWHWTFNDSIFINTQSHTITWPASSTNTVQLIVSNGVCSDTVAKTIVLDNEVIADFSMPDVICPEDPFQVTNTSKGLIDIYQWSFDVAGTSNIKDPAAVHFPQNNIESYYNIKLVCTNNTLGCTDTKQKRLRVLDNCFIAVPTAFTPNGDGLNDYLYPNNALKAENLEFSVFNRWGQLIFHTRNWQEKWDGKVGGLLQGSGVFVWFLSYTHRDTGKKVFQKGTTTLIR
jgi:gliding motility-associated-like protein